MLEGILVYKCVLCSTNNSLLSILTKGAGADKQLELLEEATCGGFWGVADSEPLPPQYHNKKPNQHQTILGHWIMRDYISMMTTILDNVFFRQ